MGCPRSDCLHLQEFWREIHGSKSPDHHMWQSEIPWKWRFLMGKSSTKMVDFGGLWWMFWKATFDYPKVIHRPNLKKQKHTPESELANSEIRSYCGRLYRLCMPMPKIRNSCPHIDTGYIPLHSIHVTWCYVDVTCMSQTFWISHWMIKDDTRSTNVHGYHGYTWMNHDESWTTLRDHVHQGADGLESCQAKTAVDELREETHKSPSKCLDVSSPESTGLPALVQLDISLTSAWHQLDISLTLCDLEISWGGVEIHSTSHFQVKI